MRLKQGFEALLTSPFCLPALPDPALTRRLFLSSPLTENYLEQDRQTSTIVFNLQQKTDQHCLVNLQYASATNPKLFSFTYLI